MSLFKRSSETIGGTPVESAEAARHRRHLIEELTFEVVPMKSLADAALALPDGAQVSVTCSPNKGIGETQRITESLVAEGFNAIPHLSARMVRDRAHTRELAMWCRSLGISTAFVVGGDARESGAYRGAVEFLGDLLEADHGLGTIGVTAYPDGHAFLSDQQMHAALRAKQQMLADAGLGGYCSTQMCFDPGTIATWLRSEREKGLTLPVHLGLAGVVDKAKLLTLGVRLGIGQSLSYLRKNRSAVTKLLAGPAYDPNELLIPLSDDLQACGVTGLHVFTFNQVAATDTWRRSQG